METGLNIITDNNEQIKKYTEILENVIYIKKLIMVNINEKMIEIENISKMNNDICILFNNIVRKCYQ